MNYNTIIKEIGDEISVEHSEFDSELNSNFNIVQIINKENISVTIPSSEIFNSDKIFSIETKIKIAKKIVSTSFIYEFKKINIEDVNIFMQHINTLIKELDFTGMKIKFFTALFNYSLFVFNKVDKMDFMMIAANIFLNFDPCLNLIVLRDFKINNFTETRQFLCIYDTNNTFQFDITPFSQYYLYIYLNEFEKYYKLNETRIDSNFDLTVKKHSSVSGSRSETDCDMTVKKLERCGSGTDGIVYDIDNLAVKTTKSDKLEFTFAFVDIHNEFIVSKIASTLGINFIENINTVFNGHKTFLAMEKILDMKKYNGEFHYVNDKSYIIQVMVIIFKLQEKNIVHGDLSNNNILIKTIKPNNTITYRNKNLSKMLFGDPKKYLVVATNYVVKVIDFGRSQVESSKEDQMQENEFDIIFNRPHYKKITDIMIFTYTILKYSDVRPLHPIYSRIWNFITDKKVRDFPDQTSIIMYINKIDYDISAADIIKQPFFLELINA